MDGELAGHGSVAVRRLVAGRTTLRAGYVEAVATAAARRGQGIGAAVMTEAERVVTGFALGALASSEQAVGFYTARGWRPWEGPLAALTPDGAVATPDEGVLVLPTPSTPAGLDPRDRLLGDGRRGDAW